MLNRVADSKYPDNICKVVHQPYQFSYTLDPRRKPPKGAAWAKAKEVAVLSYLGIIKDPTKGAVFFHNKNIRPKWARKVNYTLKIGNHVFYTQLY